MASQNLVISFEYNWFLAKNLVFHDPASLLGEKHRLENGFVIEFYYSACSLCYKTIGVTKNVY